MDIWTEKLKSEHLPILKRWAGRREGALTENDFPENEEDLPRWLETYSDQLILVYETPVGVAGLRDSKLYLLIGESGYNLIRSATYATIRMLDLAFQEHEQVTMRAYSRYTEYLDVLKKMGWTVVPIRDGTVHLEIIADVFQSRKYLF